MRRRPHILVIEDDEAIRRGLCDALTAADYTVGQAADGEVGRDRALADPIDLLLLDLMLPSLHGLEILREVRPCRPTLPIIILTAAGEEADRVRGLKLGADDYVVKPFSLRELLARIEALLRRSPTRPTAACRIDIPGGQVDCQRGEVRFDDGRSCTLGEREAELLRYLASNPARVISRDELLLHVWRTRPEGIETRTVDMHIARLREKLGNGTGAHELLKTVRGKGYMFSLPHPDETEGSDR